MHVEARFLLNVAVLAFLFSALPAMCAFAWAKGGPAERYGSTLYCVSALGAMLVRLLIRQPLPPAFELIMDALVGVGFLLLALRYSSLWLGAAMMLKGVQLSLHATHLTDTVDAKIDGFNVYAASLNLITLSLIAVFFWATLANGRASRRSQADLEHPSDPAFGSVAH